MMMTPPPDGKRTPPDKGDEEKSREEQRPVQTAAEGVGALWQRDYIATVEGSPWTPEAVIELLRADFPRFSPSLLADFSRTDGKTEPLQEGDTMHINIRGAGHCAVMATLLEPKSFTFLTQEGHLEAGRITFGADRNAEGQLVMQIRSRSRIADGLRNVMYLIVGKHAQTAVWTTFLTRVTEAIDGKLVGDIVTTMEEVPDRPADHGRVEKPTLEEPEGLKAA